MTDVEIELEHIWLEARAERWPQLERFLFSYFCFRHQYLTRHGKPDRRLAEKLCPCSENAELCTETVLEPLVPLDAVQGEIKRYQRDGKLTPSTLRRLLDSLLHYAVISRQQKQRLKDLGYSNSMPAIWYQKDEKSITCRFEAAGITLKLVPF